jgi:hypothetical protein
VAEEPVLPDPTKGVLRVEWKNIPDAIEDGGAVSSQIIVKQVRSYESLEALHQYISEQFRLQEVNHRIASFTLDEYEFIDWMVFADTFTRLRRV